MGFERLGGLVRGMMRMNPRSRALFAFVGKSGHSMKILTWDGTGVLMINKRLDVGRFDLPMATSFDQQHVVVSDALFAAIFAGNGIRPNKRKRTIN